MKKTITRITLSSIFIIFPMLSMIHAENKTPKEKINLSNSALIMIEFQREWLGPNGRLTKFMKDKVQFENSKKQAKIALEAARKSEMPVVHVGLFLNGNYKGFGGDHAKYGLRKVIQKYGTWKENGCKFAEGFEPHMDEFIA